MHKSAPKMPVTLQQACLRQGKKRSLLFLMGGLVLLIQGCATTPPAPTPSETAHAEAKAAYLANDYQRTLAIVEPLAIGGEPWAQYTLGYMYHYGRGVAMDKQMAKQWIQRAADQGYAPAQQALQRISASTPKKTEEEMEAPSKAPLPAGKANTAPPPAGPGAATEPSPATTQTAAAMPATPAAAAPTSPAAAAETMQPPASPPPAIAPTEASPPAAAPAPQATLPAAPAIPPASPAPPPPPAAVAKRADKGIKGRGWIETQNPQHFTIQLVGSSNEEAVIRFIHQHHLEKEAAYYSFMRNGKPWFSVIYGSYPSRDAAHQAARRLPATLHVSSPWLRAFRDIRSQLGQ